MASNSRLKRLSDDEFAEFGRMKDELMKAFTIGFPRGEDPIRQDRSEQEEGDRKTSTSSDQQCAPLTSTTANAAPAPHESRRYVKEKVVGWQLANTEEVIREGVARGRPWVTEVPGRKKVFMLKEHPEAGLSMGWARKTITRSYDAPSLPLNLLGAQQSHSNHYAPPSPLNMLKLPQNCDLRLSPLENDRNNYAVATLGNVPQLIIFRDAENAWENRSNFLKMMEGMSLQFERLCTLQASVTANLRSSGNLSHEALRNLDLLDSLNGLMSNRVAVHGTAAFRMSQEEYLKEIGDDFAENLMKFSGKKWGDSNLFHSADALTLNQVLSLRGGAAFDVGPVSQVQQREYPNAVPLGMRRSPLLPTPPIPALVTSPYHGGYPAPARPEDSFRPYVASQSQFFKPRTFQNKKVNAVKKPAGGELSKEKQGAVKDGNHVSNSSGRKESTTTVSKEKVSADLRELLNTIRNLS